MSKLSVLSFEREGWRDAVKTLRRIADDLESGERPECSIGGLVLVSKECQVDVFAFGNKADDLQAIAAFRLGEQYLIGSILDRD